MTEIVAAAATGDTRQGLASLRDLLAETLAACQVTHRRDCDCNCGAPPPRAHDVAALAARLTDVLLRLEALPAERKGSTVDDLAARRAARRTGPPDQAPASSGDQRRAGRR